MLIVSLFVSLVAAVVFLCFFWQGKVQVQGKPRGCVGCVFVCCHGIHRFWVAGGGRVFDNAYFICVIVLSFRFLSFLLFFGGGGGGQVVFRRKGSRKKWFWL